MHLLTFLGTGRYQETRYAWQGEERTTPYVSQALQHFLKADRLSVFVTKEAKDMHWETLQAAIAGACPLAAIDIPMGESEAEIWEIFAAVVQTVSPGEDIAFDITHAFRSIPLLVVLAGGFLQKARGVRLTGTYYGAFNPARKGEPTPIVDLSPAMGLFDWLVAADKFADVGSAVDLGQRLQEIQRRLYRQKATAAPKKLLSLGQTLERLSQALETVRTFDLLEEAAKLANFDVAQLTDEVGAFAQPFALLLEPLRQEYGEFAIAEPKTADPPLVLQKLYRLLQWYVAKGRYGQAILLAREWVISALCVVTGSNYRDRDCRDVLEKALNKLGREQMLDPAIANHVTDPQGLGAFWSHLGEVRNDLAHGQFRAHNFSASALKEFAETKMLTALSAHFGSFVASSNDQTA